MLTACSALALASCGGDGKEVEQRTDTWPTIERSPSQGSRRSDAVAARLESGDACGAAEEAARLRAEVTASIGSIPEVYVEDFSGLVNELIQAQIPRGGMATVELAEDTELRRKVAVKRLFASLAGDDVFQERFFREARLAAALSHPNLVAVYDVGDEDGLPFIVMEYVEGETLAELMARTGPMEPERAVDLLLQVCAGLEHAHSAGLVHRDIKPQNLLVRTDGVVKIADFGIARTLQATQLTQVGTCWARPPISPRSRRPASR